MDLQELKKTTELAHLNMDDEEIKTLYPAFEQMVGLLDTMEEAESLINKMPAAEHGSEGNLPFAGALLVTEQDISKSAAEAKSGGREDGLNIQEEGINIIEEMLQNAGERDGNFFVIPNVL